MDAVYQVLWWVSDGHEPTVDEAIIRLEHLRLHGPSPFAFTFRHPFGADEHPVDERDGGLA